MKRLLIIILFISAIPMLFSQTSSDALRYSRILYDGSARFQGLGGAIGAVGGDFSSIATNPAGLGLYTSSEFTISPYLRMENSLSNFNMETNRDNNLNIGMENLGLVFHISGNDKSSSAFKGFNFGFGMNRQNDFNNRVFMEGTNNKNSLLKEYVDILNNTPGGITPQMINDQYPFDIALAYNNNLIFLDTVNHRYKNDAPNGGLIQSKTVTTEGSINEYDFAFGINYNDRLYIGATIGIPVIRYSECTQYQEIKNDTAVHYFKSMTFNQQLETHGTGINLKVGLIYRPADWLRIGAAIHTPTYYGNMRDNWSSDMTGELDFASNSASSPLGSFDYQLITPFRAIGSVVFIIGKFGLVSGEYEYVNYSRSRFSADNASFSDVNADIKNKYKSPVNVRFGTEWRIQKFRLRGGFSYYGSPYQSSISTSEMYIASIGWGYRAKHFFVDMAYQWTQTKEDYYFYDPVYVDPSQNTYHTGTITTTVGLRF
ncbi:MAG: hypothetical protein ABSE72_02800 [Bacteroidales bacterium]